MLYSRSSYLSLPSKPGVYVFLDEKQTVLYVGKANDVKSRVSSYFTGSQLGEKTKLLVSLIDKIRLTLVESELEALLLEAFYIKKYNPKYNIRLTDNKAYILVRITNQKHKVKSHTSLKLRVASKKQNDNYPAVLLSRRMDDPHAIYFGPFPNSSAVKLVLKTIRRVFPFQSVENHLKRICLYNHLGLCPCPPVFDSPELRKTYKKNIHGLVRVFQGEARKIMKELEKERDVLSNKEHFEKAAIMQKRIDALGYITQPFRRPFEYDVNPNLRSDIRQEEMDNLKDILQSNGCPIISLEKIECYDISNTSGTNATGSMVVFVNGEKEGRLYRKFKIRRDWEKNDYSSSGVKRSREVQNSSRLPAVARTIKTDTPDDFASMAEVLKRRLKHSEWEYPGLIVVDGGKGQVSAAMSVLQENNIHIPLIGLAKREETIVIPHREYPISNNKFQISNTDISNWKFEIGNLKFSEISLPKDSKSLHLLMRIRDEAHRFAITYHRKLRSKSVTK